MEHLNALLEGTGLNIGASAVWDLTKFVGTQVLSKLRDPWVRQRVLRHAESELVRRGLSPANATHLIAVLNEKQTLTRWGEVDAVELERHIQRDVGEAGYHPVETSLLFQALLRSYVQHTSREPLVALMSADLWLQARAPRYVSDSLLLYLEAWRHPERLGATLLSQILEQAGQTEAKLTVDAAGNIAVHGPVNFRVSGEGEDGKRLREALEKVDQGEFTVVRASRPGTLTMTTGHAIFDRLMRMDGSLEAVGLGPAIYTERRLFTARTRQGDEATVEATVRQVGRTGIPEIIIADRPEFRVRITVGEQTSKLHTHFGFQGPPLTVADWAALRFLHVLTEPNTRLLLTNTGQQLMRLTFDKEQIRPLRDLTRIMMDVVDVRTFVQERLPGARFLGWPAPGFTMEDAQRLHHLAQAVRGELDGEVQTFEGNYRLNPAFADALSGRRKGNGIYFRVGQWYQLPGCTPLEICFDFINPQVLLKAGGVRLNLNRIRDWVDQTVSLRVRAAPQEVSVRISHPDAPSEHFSDSE